MGQKRLNYAKMLNKGIKWVKIGPYLSKNVHIDSNGTKCVK